MSKAQITHGPTLKELAEALKNADAAGDAEGARALAQAYVALKQKQESFPRAQQVSNDAAPSQFNPGERIEPTAWQVGNPPAAPVAPAVQTAQAAPPQGAVSNFDPAVFTPQAAVTGTVADANKAENIAKLKEQEAELISLIRDERQSGRSKAEQAPKLREYFQRLNDIRKQLPGSPKETMGSIGGGLGGAAIGATVGPVTSAVTSVLGAAAGSAIGAAADGMDQGMTGDQLSGHVASAGLQSIAWDAGGIVAFKFAAGTVKLSMKIPGVAGMVESLKAKMGFTHGGTAGRLVFTSTDPQKAADDAARDMASAVTNRGEAAALTPQQLTGDTNALEQVTRDRSQYMVRARSGQDARYEGMVDEAATTMAGAQRTDLPGTSLKNAGERLDKYVGERFGPVFGQLSDPNGPFKGASVDVRGIKAKAEALFQAKGKDLKPEELALVDRARGLSDTITPTEAHNLQSIWGDRAREMRKEGDPTSTLERQFIAFGSDMRGALMKSLDDATKVAEEQIEMFAKGAGQGATLDGARATQQRAQGVLDGPSTVPTIKTEQQTSLELPGGPNPQQGMFNEITPQQASVIDRSHRAQGTLDQQRATALGDIRRSERVHSQLNPEAPGVVANGPRVEPKDVAALKEARDAYREMHSTVYSDSMSRVLRTNPEHIVKQITSKGNVTEIQDVRTLMAFARRLEGESGPIATEIREAVQGIKAEYLRNQLATVDVGSTLAVRLRQDADYRRTFNAIFDTPAERQVVEKLTQAATMVQRGDSRHNPVMLMLATGVRTIGAPGTAAVLMIAPDVLAKSLSTPRLRSQMGRVASWATHATARGAAVTVPDFVRQFAADVKEETGADILQDKPA